MGATSFGNQLVQRLYASSRFDAELPKEVVSCCWSAVCAGHAMKAMALPRECLPLQQAQNLWLPGVSSGKGREYGERPVLSL